MLSLIVKLPVNLVIVAPIPWGATTVPRSGLLTVIVIPEPTTPVTNIYSSSILITSFDLTVDKPLVWNCVSNTIELVRVAAIPVLESGDCIMLSTLINTLLSCLVEVT